MLQESCIYCYHTPQSETSRDVIVLRGYDVVADVKTLNRVRFIFHLQQQVEVFSLSNSFKLTFL